MRQLISQFNYYRSNRLTRVRFPVSKHACHLANQLLICLEAEDRQVLGEQLLDELSDLAQIDIIQLTIADAKQYHRKRNNRVVLRQYGYYQTGSKYIYITNRTAVRGQILAPKTFLDTLLHEWLHHYDTQALRLRSIHSKGFYARLKDLKEKLNLKTRS